MDKEIIIDGVNVAGCYFYYKGECRCEQNCIDDDKGETIEELFYREPEHNKWECEPSKNCYYKQLKRLEQENDKLKEEVETRDNLVEHFRKEAINWAKISNNCIKDIENYKQTLQEIKTIAERAFAVCDDDCGNANKFTEILDLITKAEEE